MRENRYSGKLIVFEGLDGSGQSTQAEFLKDFLKEKGYKVILTKEPTLDSQAGKEIKEVLEKKKKISPKELQELFAKDRKEHLKTLIIPALEQGKVVISDRYFFSSFAYGQASGLDLNWLIKINNEFLLPDITFFLAVSPKVCLERIKKRKKERTLFEEKEKLEKVYRNYQKIAKKFPNVKIINGEKPIKEVFEKIKGLVEKFEPKVKNFS